MVIIQVCDTRFVIAYLVKYAAGEDERFMVRLRQVQEDACDVALVDEKIRKKSKHKEEGHGYKIAETEMTTHLLQLATISATWEPIHVSTAPPEERYVTLKPEKSVPTEVRGPAFGVRLLFPGEEGHYRCGADQRGQPLCPLREPTAGQREEYIRCQFARTNPDKVLSRGKATKQGC